MQRADIARIASWGFAAIVVVVLGLSLARDGGGGGAPPPVKLDTDTPTEPKAVPAGAREIFVSVTGEVGRPGLIRLPENARVAEALQRAGGPTRRGEITSVNLAAKLRDGQQVVVPRRGAGAPGPAPGGSGSAASSAAPSAGAPGAAAHGQKISLASATLVQLDTLDGIGPTLAQRILQYRDQHGGFRSLEELRQVEGIGEKRFQSLRAALDP